jgi:hypothetical protein
MAYMDQTPKKNEKMKNKFAKVHTTHALAYTFQYRR